jgi:hypothetical protein
MVQAELVWIGEVLSCSGHAERQGEQKCAGLGKAASATQLIGNPLSLKTNGPYGKADGTLSHRLNADPCELLS